MSRNEPTPSPKCQYEKCKFPKTCDWNRRCMQSELELSMRAKSTSPPKDPRKKGSKTSPELSAGPQGNRLIENFLQHECLAKRTSLRKSSASPSSRAPCRYWFLWRFLQRRSRYWLGRRGRRKIELFRLLRWPD